MLGCLVTNGTRYCMFGAAYQVVKTGVFSITGLVQVTRNKHVRCFHGPFLGWLYTCFQFNAFVFLFVDIDKAGAYIGDQVFNIPIKTGGCKLKIFIRG